MKASDTKQCLVGRQVYYRLAKSKFNCRYLTPRKLYTVTSHRAGSSLIGFNDDDNYPILTGVLRPSEHLNDLATFSLKKETPSNG